MQVMLTQDHPGEGKFPLFFKGTPVRITGPGCTHYRGWFPCEIEGYNTYIPDVFITDTVLNRDYDPTELAVRTGDVLDAGEIIYAWLYAVSRDGKAGWVPAEAVISLKN